MEDAVRVDRAGVRLVLLERRRARDAEVRQRERADERRRRPGQEDRDRCSRRWSCSPCRGSCPGPGCRRPDVRSRRRRCSSSSDTASLCSGAGEVVPAAEVGADRGRVERRAVLELHALAKRERPGKAALRRLPRQRERRNELRRPRLQARRDLRRSGRSAAATRRPRRAGRRARPDRTRCRRRAWRSPRDLRSCAVAQEQRRLPSRRMRTRSKDFLTLTVPSLYAWPSESPLGSGEYLRPAPARQRSGLPAPTDEAVWNFVYAATWIRSRSAPRRASAWPSSWRTRSRGQVELVPDRLERPRLALEAEAQLEDPPLALRKRVERTAHALAAQRLLGFLERIGGLAVGEEIAELALVVGADRLVERDGRVGGGERLVDVLHRQAGRLGELLLRRLAARARPRAGARRATASAGARRRGRARGSCARDSRRRAAPTGGSTRSRTSRT